MSSTSHALDSEPPRGRTHLGIRPLAAATTTLALGACTVPRAQYECTAIEMSSLCASLRQPSARVPWTLRRTIAHDASSFTEGLVYLAGRLYESSGQRDSRLAEIDPTTGKTLRTVRWPRGPDEPTFGEGLATDGQRLVQLSWQSMRARTWDIPSLAPGPTLPYAGEGWGLCHDGHRYIRTDGQARLTFHDPMTFAATPGPTVTLDGEPVIDLNELECVADHVLANVWHKPYVLWLRTDDGRTEGVLDFTPLIRREARAGGENVLNGLAFDPTTNELYVTGKKWHHIYVVELPVGLTSRTSPPVSPSP